MNTPHYYRRRSKSMTLKNPFKPLTPHGERRLSVHFIIILLVAVIAYCASGCRPQKGCYSTRGMSGYGWIKNIETKKVFILNRKGQIICTFIDANGMLHSRQ